MPGVNAPAWRLGSLGLLAFGLAAGAMPLLQRFGDDTFFAVSIALAAVAALAARGDPAGSRGTVAIILAAGLAMRLAVIASPPILSTDIFRYVWDGRVQAAGINPYRYVPADPALASLRDALIYPFINRADYAVTIYPPTAQVFFLLVTRVSESPVAIKLGLVACEGVTAAAILGLLARTGQPASRLAAYAWHPLPVFEIAGQGHVDGLMLVFMMAGIWAVLAKGRPIAGAVLITLGALAKPFALLALPALWRPWNWRMVLAVPLTAALAYAPYRSVGAGVLGFLGTGYVQEQGIAGGWGFALLRLWRAVFGEHPHDTGVYITLALGLIVSLSLRAGFRRTDDPRRRLRDIAGLCVALLVLVSPEYPWYALLAAPFVAVAATGAVWVLTVGSLGLYDVVPGDPQWSFETRSALLTAAVLAVAAADRYRRIGRMP
jgi:alpha-1,6-mannosyltransferase